MIKNKNSFSIKNNKANKYNDKTCSIMSFKKYIKNKRKYPFRKYSSNLYSNLNETEYIKSKLISTTQSSQYNLKNIQQALKKEELIPKKQEKINQKFINLYNKDKKSKEILNKNNLIQRQKKDNLKLGECTFKPKKCKNKLLEKKINKLYTNSNIYERNIKNQLRHNEKIALLFNEFSKINNNYRSCECFFHPNINNNNNIEKILYDDSNIWKEQANNNSNKLFLLRYMKAREKEFDKQNKLNNSSISKKLSYNYFYPKKLTRNLSEKDSLIMRRNLHNSLYSFKSKFTDDDNDE